jgi:hypothetical protein
VAARQPEPEHDEIERGGDTAAPDRWDAYPLFVVALMAIALLCTFGLGAHLWSLLSAVLTHAHH